MLQAKNSAEYQARILHAASNMKKSMIACIAAALALTACASQKSADITGTWLIDEAMGTSTEAGMNQAFITFDGDGKINGNASVNLFNGDYSIKGNELKLSNIAMTKMMGENMEIEDAVTEALNTVASVVIEEGKARFLSAGEETVMTAARKN